MLSQDLLKEMFDYDPDSGVFIAKVTVNQRKKGDVVGSIGNDGYLYTLINNKLYYLHRLAFLYMEGKLPPGQVYHRDKNKINNSWNNLKHSTNQENQRNLSIRADNTSGITGISWHKDVNKWQANIKVNGKLKHLGHFNKLKEARIARRAAEGKYGFTCE